MDKAEKCLERRNNKRKIYYRTEKGYNLVNQAQEMITRERCVVLDEKQILIPGCEIWFTDGEVIDAFATKENETYYMFINKAIIEEQKEYLEKLNWKFLIDSGIKEEYIDSLIESMITQPEVLNKLEQLFPEGFYVLPSSVHEVLIVPDNGEMEPKMLGEMVREVNKNEVERQEVLSDRVYSYDKEKHQIRQEPDSIQKVKEMER